MEIDDNGCALKQFNCFSERVKECGYGLIKTGDEWLVVILDQSSGFYGGTVATITKDGDVTISHTLPASKEIYGVINEYANELSNMSE